MNNIILRRVTHLMTRLGYITKVYISILLQFKRLIYLQFDNTFDTISSFLPSTFTLNENISKAGHFPYKSNNHVHCNVVSLKLI